MTVAEGASVGRLELSQAMAALEGLQGQFSGWMGVAAAWLGPYGDGKVWERVRALRALGARAGGASATEARSPLGFHAQEPYRAASVIKLPILCEVFRQARAGKLDMRALVELREDEQVTGSGVLKDMTPGVRIPVRDLAVLMITVSDNTATNLLIDLVGGPGAVNALSQELGLNHTTLSGKLQIPPERYSELQRRGVRTTTSPADMVRLLELVYRGPFPGLADEDRWAILDILTRQQHLPSIGRYLPFDPDSVEDGEPVGAVVGSKSGSIRGVRHDVGIVWTPQGAYAVALMSRDGKDLRFHPENEAEVLLGRAGLIVYRYFCGH